MDGQPMRCPVCGAPAQGCLCSTSPKNQFVLLCSLCGLPLEKCQCKIEEMSFTDE